MNQVYGAENIGYFPGPEKSLMGIYVRDQDSRYWTDRPAFLAAWHRARLLEEFVPMPAYHGHTPLFLYPKNLVDNMPVVTIVRHPMSLIFSWYLWEKSHPYMVNFETVDDFIEQRPRQNIQTEMVGNLEDVDAAISYEFLEQGICMLANKLHWPTFVLPRTNLSPSPTYTDRLRELVGNRDLQKRILALNEADMELYYEVQFKAPLWTRREGCARQ